MRDKIESYFFLENVNITAEVYSESS